MNRLATRLLLAFLVVALTSLAAVPIAQSVAARRTFGELGPEFRRRVERSLDGPPRAGFRGPPPSRFGPEGTQSTLPPNGQLPDGQLGGQAPGEGFLREENTRLFSLLSDYREAQRQAALFGVGGAVLLSVLLALLLSRTIARPIEKVSKAASKLAEGALGTRVTLGPGLAPSLEVRRLAADFNAMASALGKLEGERKAMIADIAHELRNPLATLQLRLDALSDGLIRFNDDEAQLLQGQVGLLGRLIGDLRTLSLADAERLALHRLELDLNDLTENVVRHAQPRGESQGVRLAFVPADEPDVVSADPDRLTQVLGNLLDNAFRVTPAGGEVAVQLFVTQTEVTLRVRDAGPGIAEDELGTVFERFVQGKRRDTNSKSGSGLGLAIVQSLVKLHGGWVQAGNWRDEDGGGAQLEVTLPVAPSRLEQNS